MCGARSLYGGTPGTAQLAGGGSRSSQTDWQSLVPQQGWQSLTPCRLASPCQQRGGNTPLSGNGYLSVHACHMYAMQRMVICRCIDQSPVLVFRKPTRARMFGCARLSTQDPAKMHSKSRWQSLARCAEHSAAWRHRRCALVARRRSPYRCAVLRVVLVPP